MWVSVHINTKPEQRHSLVDVPVIGRRLRGLPWEVFTTTGWLGEEVSRGHSSWRIRAVTLGIKAEDSQSDEGPNVM